MSNPSNSPAPNLLARLERLLRIQMPGAPQADVKGALEDILQLAQGDGGTPAATAASGASDDVLTRLSAVEGAIEALKQQITTAPAPEAEDPTVGQRLDAIDRAVVALQADVSKLETAPRATAPARAAAPTARPSAATA